jgi:MFS family permease
VKARQNIFEVIQITTFRQFLLFRFFMTIASQMLSVIVGWQLYEITHDPLDLGLIGLAEAIPQIGVALFAGHIADRFDRRKIILITNFSFFICALVLFLYSIDFMSFYSVLGTLPIFVVVFIIGVVRGTMYPAITAFWGQLIPENLFPQASTWNSGVWHIAAVAGPAVGGLIYGFAGVKAAYLAAMIISVFAFSMLLIVPVQKQPDKTSDMGLWKSLGEGIRFVFQKQVILASMALDMFAVLFGGAVALLPVFAADILHTGPEGLGVLRACPAFGAVLMSVWLAWHPPVKNSGIKMFLGVAGFGLCIVLFAISENFWISAGLLLLSGIFDNISVVVRSTVLQLYTPNEMRGRVASVNSIFIGSSNELGSFESGLAAKLMGVVPSVIFGGCMTLGIVGFTAWRLPILRKLQFKEDHS